MSIHNYHTCMVSLPSGFVSAELNFSYQRKRMTVKEDEFDGAHCVTTEVTGGVIELADVMHVRRDGYWRPHRRRERWTLSSRGRRCSSVLFSRSGCACRIVLSGSVVRCCWVRVV